MNASTESRTTRAAQLAERYLALWNEPDASARRRMIGELWTDSGRQILQPPMEMRRLAAGPGLGLAAALEARGQAELEARATASYAHWVASEGLAFRGGADAERLDDVVKFRWEAVTGDGAVMATGLNVFVLAADGRIERNYTFVDD
jgi:hypothetical protein